MGLLLLASNVSIIASDKGTQVPLVAPAQSVQTADSADVAEADSKATVQKEVAKSTETVKEVSKETKGDPLKDKKVEEYVRNYFSDIPVMIEIARCESHFRQKDESGDVLEGEVNNLDKGVMQINQFYHGESAEKLGYDIMTLQGNTAYARHIFELYGVKPWISSYPCWGRTQAYSDYAQKLALN